MIMNKNSFHLPKTILYVTIPQHVLGFLLGFYLILFQNVSWTWLLASYIAWVFLGVIGIGIFYHKYFAHKSFATFRTIEAVGAYLGAMAGLGGPIGWVALHNDHHHRYADKDPLDVHSPTQGMLSSYIGWQFQRFDLQIRSARQLFRNPCLKFLERYYYQVYWLTAFLLFLIDPLLPVYILFMPGFMHYHVENILSCFCHLKKYGYRNFETNDHSVNILWFGILTWGAGFHNNHHGQISATHYQVRPYEIDLSRLIIFFIPKKIEPNLKHKTKLKLGR